MPPRCSRRHRRHRRHRHRHRHHRHRRHRRHRRFGMHGLVLWIDAGTGWLGTLRFGTHSRKSGNNNRGVKREEAAIVQSECARLPLTAEAQTAFILTAGKLALQFPRGQEL